MFSLSANMVQNILETLQESVQGSPGLFSLFLGEIRSLDGKCCAGCVTTKLIQTIVEYNL